MITTHKHPARHNPLRSGRNTVHERWSSTGIVVLAAGGAAIGFNNFWSFPQLAVQYGGGAFLIVYFLSLLLIGLPLLMAEFALGRSGRASPIGTFRYLTRRAHANPLWKLVGWMGVLSVFLILSYLSVIAGWVIAYLVRSAFGVFAGLTADGMNAQFAHMVRDPERQLFWHTLFMIVTMLMVARGVRHGLEAVVRYAVPLLLGLLLGLTIYVATTDAFRHATTVFFTPDFGKLTGMGVLAAMSHAFFSLGLGAGAMLMYGAYLSVEVRILRLSFNVVGIDTLTSLAVTLVILSLLSAGNVELSSGPSLVFQSLPLAFDHIPYGRLLIVVFFVLLVMAALTSAIALAEPVMVWLSEQFGMSLRRSALLCGLGAWSLGVATILSFHDWAFSFKVFGVVKKLGFFDIMQLLTAHVLLPVSGILMAFFAGWALKPDMLREVLHLRPAWLYFVWLWLIRVVIPGLLLLVLIKLPELFA
ncbi:MAG: sodium-dependent transporter [Gammaproteobacteria bacterium]|nr:sodium-dependent transporter [Gammaproteobacteria bacterium]